MKYLQELLIVKYAASITSSATPCCCDHFLHSLISLPHQVAPTAHLEFVNIPIVNYFSNNSTKFNANFTFSVTFHFFAVLLSLLDCSLFWLLTFINITWICHWETRSQHNPVLSCPCVDWTQVRRDQALTDWGRTCPPAIYAMICGLKSKQWSLCLTQVPPVTTPC